MIGMRINFPWEPKHKLRFVAMCPDLTMRALLIAAFVKSDSSLYIMPKVNSPVILRRVEPEGERLLQQEPGADFHISIHASGVVNVSTGADSVRLHDVACSDPQGCHVATLQFNSLTNMPIISDADFNRSKSRESKAVIGPGISGPLMLSVYCAPTEAKWNPTYRGDGPMLHYAVRMNGQAHEFHFVGWSSSSMPYGPLDVALLFREESGGV